MHYHLTKYGHEKIHMLVEAETSGKNVRNDLGCNIQLNEIVVKKVYTKEKSQFLIQHANEKSMHILINFRKGLCTPIKCHSCRRNPSRVSVKSKIVNGISVTCLPFPLMNRLDSKEVGIF